MFNECSVINQLMDESKELLLTNAKVCWEVQIIKRKRLIDCDSSHLIQWYNSIECILV
jgi:hypothetical protein